MFAAFLLRQMHKNVLEEILTANDTGVEQVVGAILRTGQAI